MFASESVTVCCAQVPHGYQDIYSQASWRFPAVTAAVSRGSVSNISTLSMASMVSMASPEDYSTSAHPVSPHASPGRAMVAAGAQYTAASPHSSPGNVMKYFLETLPHHLAPCRRPRVLARQPLQRGQPGRGGGGAVHLPRLQPVLPHLLLHPPAPARLPPAAPLG